MAAFVDDCCGAEPPATVTGPDGREWTPSDCWCTLPPHPETEEHRCQPCTNRHGAPGWKDT